MRKGFPDNFDSDLIYEERLGLTSYLEREARRTLSRLLATLVFALTVVWYVIR